MSRRSCKHWKVKEIAADEAYWVSELEQLAAERLPVVKFPQTGEGMLQATARTFELIVGGDLAHDGDPDFTRRVATAPRGATCRAVCGSTRPRRRTRSTRPSP